MPSLCKISYLCLPRVPENTRCQFHLLASFTVLHSTLQSLLLPYSTSSLWYWGVIPAYIMYTKATIEGGGIEAAHCTRHFDGLGPALFGHVFVCVCVCNVYLHIITTAIDQGNKSKMAASNRSDISWLIAWAILVPPQGPMTTWVFCLFWGLFCVTHTPSLDSPWMIWVLMRTRQSVLEPFSNVSQHWKRHSSSDFVWATFTEVTSEERPRITCHCSFFDDSLKQIKPSIGPGMFPLKYWCQQNCLGKLCDKSRVTPFRMMQVTTGNSDETLA